MALAMVIWISLRAGGGGDFFNKPSQVHGSERAWLWLSNLTSVTGGYSTLAVNIAGFSRFSKERRSQVWQLPVIPFFKTIVALFGVISASAAQEIWGVTYWTPLEIIGTWQNTAGGRAAGFICACIWLLAQISVNISANAVSFANDITTVAPKWFNIRRGTVFVAFIGGWALCPWIIVASGKAFLNFMSAYAIFMAPMAGILFTDYWLIKRKKYDVPALYNPNGIYSYGKYGTNWRASLTMVLVIIPVMPGLAAKVSPTSVHIDQDELARGYTLVNDTQFNTGLFLLDRLEVGPGMRVLDVGCGPGNLTAHIADIVGSEGHVDGVDPSKERLALAREVARPNLSFHVGTAEDLSQFKTATYDIVFVNSTFHWVQDQPAAIAEFARVLRPGGRLGMSGGSGDYKAAHEKIKEEVLGREPYRNYPVISGPKFIKQKDLDQLLAGAGFKETTFVINKIVKTAKDGEAMINWLDSSSSGKTYGGVPVELRSKVREEMKQEWEKLTTKDGIHMDMQLLVTVATRG
ncbi:putative permease [Colletotrichum sp. SAR 10_96]|nr:putative permease [Colletotrichum sp. SAR 10_96]